MHISLGNKIFPSSTPLPTVTVQYGPSSFSNWIPLQLYDKVDESALLPYDEALCEKGAGRPTETHITEIGGVDTRAHKPKEQRKYGKSAAVATSQEIVAWGFSSSNEQGVGITTPP